jgi:predicted MPP superfamily phosphohydrolase
MSKNARRLGSILILLLGLGIVIWGYLTATRDPVVRSATIALAGWPEGSSPIRAVLISDIHIIAPDMPPERLAGIVRRINGLKPDLVLIAGDFVSDRTIATHHYPATALIPPLAQLRPRLGTFAVLGNHDHWRNESAVRRALREAGVVVLDNQAREVGPLALGGIDDSYTHHADLGRTLARMRRIAGARVLLSHSPDPFAKVPADVSLMVAGHTHCGQISLPIIGAIMTASSYGRRFVCGRVDETGRTLIVTAGLGTSNLPIRLGAVPDIWLLTLQGKRAPTESSIP